MGHLIHHCVVPLSRLRARAPRGKTILNRFLTLSVSLRYPRGKVEGASLREGGAEQSEAEGERVSLFIYRWLFRTLNGTQAPSVTFGATSLSEGGLDNPSPLCGAVSPAGSVTSGSLKNPLNSTSLVLGNPELSTGLLFNTLGFASLPYTGEPENPTFPFGEGGTSHASDG